jgi:hypothetical protein
MSETTVKKVNAKYSPRGSMGQKYLEPFTAVEATTPPAHIHDRDQV